MDLINLLVELEKICSHLILTKADRIKEERLMDIAHAIQPINPFVSILSVLFGKLSIEEVLAMPGYNYHRVAQLAEELKPVMEAEAQGDDIQPRSFDLPQGTTVLAFDREDRLSAFAGGAAPFAVFWGLWIALSLIWIRHRRTAQLSNLSG